jgi:chemosensory pili system protein ChpA (sensor histidine kinase/response regulator)
LQFFRAEPTRLTSDSISLVLASAWSLSDYLQTTKDKVPCSELSLYAQYQSLGQLLTVACHPMELWASAEQMSTISHWSTLDVLQALQRHALNRKTLSAAEAEDLHDQIDELMLGLVRHKNPECAAKLQSLCNWRLMHSDVASHVLTGTLLIHAIDGLSNGYLDLDVFLKRYLLGSMPWLKGMGADDARLLKEAAFFNYVVWLRQPTTVQNELNQLANWAEWSPRRSGDYGHMFFGQFERDQLLLLQNAIDAARQQWSEWCARESSVESAGEIPTLVAAFNKMKHCLESVHPSSHALNLVLQNILSTTSLYSKHDVQVEVATLLLLLNSLATDIYAVEAADIERHFDDLTKRLKNVCQGHSVGDFEPWMVEYQQRQGWMNAMNSSIEHLTQKLNEIENILKHLWTNPAENAALGLLPKKLRQMSSVAQSLDMHHLAAIINPIELRVAAWVHNNQTMDLAQQQQMTSDVAALGLQLHMWTFQSAPTASETIFAPPALPAELRPHLAAASELGHDLDEAEESMMEVFLDEANDLFPHAHAAIGKLLVQPSDSESVAIVKRSFHTLKGSARVVGLMEFGDAAWLMEKHLNDSLIGDQPMTKPSLLLCESQLSTMQTWVQQLRAQNAPDAVQIDWGLDALAVAIHNVQISPLFELPPADFLDLTPLVTQADSPMPIKVEIEEPVESQMKTIGDLQISIPLYQAFLSETDEWSRQLALILSEWALDDLPSIPSQALMWAHALSGSSATIGFAGCAHLAKLVERLIEKIQTQNFNSPELSKNLALAAEDIRRLLHQFAAGFIKEPEPKLLVRIENYLAEPVPLPEPVAKTKKTISQDAEMLAIFQEESDQLLPELGAALRGWARAPEQQDYKTQALRVLHTLKGSARLVGEQALAQSAHDLESQIEALGISPSAANLAELLASYDQLTDRSVAPVKVKTTAKPALTPMVAIVPSGETIRIQSNTVDRLVNQTGEIMRAPVWRRK